MFQIDSWIGGGGEGGRGLYFYFGGHLGLSIQCTFCVFSPNKKRLGSNQTYLEVHSTNLQSTHTNYLTKLLGLSSAHRPPSTSPEAFLHFVMIKRVCSREFE